MFPSHTFDLMFNIMPVIVLFVFLIIIGMFIAILVNLLRTKRRNDAAPRLSVPARVTAKRTHVTMHHHQSHRMMHTSSHYYATFEFASGDRAEFSVSSTEYAMLAEGDSGTLSFQGTRYLGFTRG